MKLTFRQAMLATAMHLVQVKVLWRDWYRAKVETRPKVG